jgi:eukaryotic-like serine/threonine-protein kinase
MSAPASDAKEILGRAIKIVSGNGRKAYLDRACRGNRALRDEVEGLIETLELNRDLRKVPAATEASHTLPHEEVHESLGTLIGPYKVLEQIGAGGMGVVYMADQQAPIRRRVALKIIKPGMDTDQVIARFEAERQALALMDHPNIAKVLDAGTTDSGRPYFVMELVRGIPITEYCDQNCLSVPERLDLFVQICHAAQHAHQKGIIHRDIKPSNVLVTLHDGRPVPKVIDFGVAKATSQQLTEKTLFTSFSQMIGTPLYMSPEQAKMTGLDVDTRSDIYSLGVLLYELLTGTTPFDENRIRTAAYDEIRRIIREEEPPLPSTRISTLGQSRTTVAAHRHVDADRLRQLVRGDLDWIVMKALEKDRRRRYETADGLANDIVRYLGDQPVDACPPSAMYRFRKFARRNRMVLTTAGLVSVALVLGTLLSTWQAIRATRAEHLAAARLAAECVAHNDAEAARASEAAQRKMARDQQKIAEEKRTEAEQHRARAEADFQKARCAIDQFVDLVYESDQLDSPNLQPLRQGLLEPALRFYQEFDAEQTHDTAVPGDHGQPERLAGSADLDLR